MTKLDSSKYCYVSLTTQTSVICLHTNGQTVLFLTIQFSISHLFALIKYQSSIRPIVRSLSGATTPSQSGPGSDGNEGVLSITGASKSV